MKAELLNIFGNDLMVVNAAKVSYGKESSELTEKEKGLIRFLWKSGHTSPFRHPQIQFRISCPVFVERQLFKHQVGLTANSISGRYVDFSDEYWTPEVLRKQSKDSKQGSDGEINNPELIKKIKEHLKNSEDLYSELSENGVAKELARIVCPLSLYTTFIWTGSLHAYLHLFSLRLKKDAQEETRNLVSQIYSQLKNHPDNPFEHSLQAWWDYSFCSSTWTKLDKIFHNRLYYAFMSLDYTNPTPDVLEEWYKKEKLHIHKEIGMSDRELSEFWNKISG